MERLDFVQSGSYAFASEDTCIQYFLSTVAWKFKSGTGEHTAWYNSCRLGPYIYSCWHYLHQQSDELRFVTVQNAMSTVYVSYAIRTYTQYSIYIRVWWMKNNVNVILPNMFLNTSGVTHWNGCPFILYLSFLRICAGLLLHDDMQRRPWRIGV